MTRTKDWIQRHERAVYTILFVIAAGVVFSFVPVYQTSLIHAADGFNQCYPTYAYIGRYIREFLPNLLQYHTIPMFDFCIGYGDDVLTTLNWFGFGNILYLLAAFVPEKFDSVTFTCQSILQLYLAGLAFLWTIKSHESDRKGNTWSRLTGALVYAFSAYALSYGINFPSFLLALITFPMIMSGVTSVLESGQWRWSKRYIATIFILSCSGFYFLYMDIVAIAVYGLLYGCIHYRHRVAAFWKVVACIAAQTAIAVGMAAVILLPVIFAYLRSARSAEQSWTKEILSLFAADEMIERLTGVLDIDPAGTAIGFTIPIVVLVVVFLIRYRRKCPVLASCVVFGILGYFVPATGSIMNGFSYSIDRWVYMLHYLVAVIAVIVLPELPDLLREKRIRRVVNVAAVVVFCVWAMASICCGAEELSQIIMHVAWIGVSFLILLLLEHRAKALLTIYCAACTILVASLYYAPAEVGGRGIHKSFKNFYTWHEIAASQFANASAMDEFYRTDIYDTSLDAALVTETNGTSSYYSICNSGPYRFLNERLVSTATEGSSFTQRGLDGRMALEMFFSVNSYALNRDAEEIVQNSLQLPLGFTYTSYMLESDAQALDPLDRNQNVLQLVELETAPNADTLTQVMQTAQDWITLPAEIAYCDITLNGDHTFVADETSEIRVMLPHDICLADKEYYLVLHGLEWVEDGFERYLEVNGKRLRLVPKGTYAGESTEYMVKVDLTEETLDRGYCNVRFQKEGIYRLEDIELRQLDVSQYAADYEALTESVLEDTAIGMNRIAGTITTDRDRILLMTIPYSTGWTCRVDGVLTEVYKADQGFSAVVIGLGTHEVVWTYCTPGIVPGLCISVLSVMILILLVQYERRKVMKAASYVGVTQQ